LVYVKVKTHLRERLAYLAEGGVAGRVGDDADVDLDTRAPVLKRRVGVTGRAIEESIRDVTGI
jgi:hypothetical protein